MIKKIFTLSLTILLYHIAAAQTGDIQGRVTDKATGEGIPFASIVVENNGLQAGATTTDFDGNYSIKPLNPGEYAVIVSFVGYQPSKTQGVVVRSDKSTFLDITLNAGIDLDVVEVITYEVPLISEDNTSSGLTLTKEDIQNLPTRNLNTIAARSAGVGQSDQGSGITIRGSGSVQYVVDGIPISGATNLPPNAIEQVNVITGGIPAKYGDVTGGVINITTKGASSQTNGSFSILTSQFLDAYGYNLGNFTLTGPLLYKDKASDKKKPLLGYFILGEFLYQKDPDPSAGGVYKVKDEVLADLKENPVRISPVGTGLQLNAEYLTNDDIERIKYKPNSASNLARVVTRFDLNLSDNARLAVGANFGYNPSRRYINSFTLMNAENNFQDINTTMRGYVRFTQNFNKNEGGEENKETASYLQNAFYSVQASYTKNLSKNQGVTHKENIFDIGHVGKFNTNNRSIYFYGQDSTTGLWAYQYFGDVPNGVTFEPDENNADFAKYTTQYYNLVNPNPLSTSEILTGGGIVNGFFPGTANTGLAYSMWVLPGYPANGFAKANSDQFNFRIDASVDVKKPGEKDRNRHAIEFGIQYEQQVNRSYFIGPYGLWSIMPLLTNRHIANIDFSDPHPVFIDVNGNGIFDQGVDNFLDTINYGRKFVADDQSFFDKNLRLKLGLDPSGDDLLDVNELDPEILSLDMFSASDLLDNNLVSYFGYDYLGNRLSKQPTLDDFFNEKDANGNYTRNIAAFSPIYTAAYIQDRFAFRDLIFNVGIRVDRYDANQPVPLDIYSLYKIRTAGEVGTVGSGSITHPSTIGDDYAVYVDNIEDPTSVLGYRKDNVWYDAEGNELSSGKALAENSSTGQIQPYLKENQLDNINLSAEDFTDYEPQINVMPRVAFSFPISEDALFFAHYDVLTQRPGGNRFNPVSYYYFNQTGSQSLPNPNLQPEKTISYELGFKQTLSRTSALSLSTFYREIRDQIATIPVIYAYPKDYVMLGNIDFGTTKGFTVDYDLRRTGNVSMRANYTLLFAQGTAGSGLSATQAITAARNTGLGNIRTITPLGTDNRHRINVTLDYRYGNGKDYNGPKISGKDAFANSGANLSLTTYSGRPYTARSNPVTLESGVADRAAIAGTPGGSRYPWYFRLDAGLDKNFRLKTNEIKQKSLNCRVYLQIQNILNTRNVINVYPYTGSANDDGYLASDRAQQRIPSQTNPQSYIDLYNIAVLNPSNYSVPRTIRLGADVYF